MVKLILLMIFILQMLLCVLDMEIIIEEITLI